MVTILEGNPGHCRGKVIERKILGSGLRLGGLGDSLRKLGTLDWVLYRMAAAVLPVIVSVTLSTERGDWSKYKSAIGK